MSAELRSLTKLIGDNIPHDKYGDRWPGNGNRCVPGCLRCKLMRELEKVR